MTNNKIYTWNTKKTEKGFKFSVSELTPRKTKNKQGQFVDTKTLISGLFSNRNKAKLMGQKFVRFFKNNKMAKFSLKR